MPVDIIDIGSGNINSIVHCLNRVHVHTRVVNHVEQLSAKVIILPGVGSAGFFMEQLHKYAFVDAILEHVNSGNKLIGICLGFQAMTQFMEEDGGVEGLGLLKARTVALPQAKSHNQWEAIQLNKAELAAKDYQAEFRLTKKRVFSGRVFYNHEYGVRCLDKRFLNMPISPDLAPFSAMVINQQIIGMQFHPEKSQASGLALLKMIL